MNEKTPLCKVASPFDGVVKRTRVFVSACTIFKVSNLIFEFFKKEILTYKFRLLTGIKGDFQVLSVIFTYIFFNKISKENTS